MSPCGAPLVVPPPLEPHVECFRQVYLILKRKAPLEPRSTCGTPTETLSQLLSLSRVSTVRSRFERRWGAPWRTHARPTEISPQLCQQG